DLIAEAQAELRRRRGAVDRDFQKTGRAGHCERSAGAHGAVAWRDETEAFTLRKDFARLVAEHPQALRVNVRNQIAETVNVNNLTLDFSIADSESRPGELHKILQPWTKFLNRNATAQMRGHGREDVAAMKRP